MKILPFLLAVTLTVVSAWRWPWQTSETREVLVTFGEHKRSVTVVNDSYQSLLAGFLETFSDVLPPVPTSAILFERCKPDTQHCGVGIIEGDSIEGLNRVCASIVPPIIGSSYPLVSNKTYNLWSLGSRAGNGYLRRQGAATVTADGDGQTGIDVESQWIAYEEVNESPRWILWKFFSPNKKKVLAVEKDQVTVKDPTSVSGKIDLFLPSRNGRYQSFLPYAYLESGDKKFLAAVGNGTVKLVTNKMPADKHFWNPSPQTLFIPFLYT